MDKDNARDVTICIRGTQYAPALQGETPQQESARTETTAQGTYYERSGAHYLFWEERLEGMDAPVQSRLKYRGGCLEVTRRGGMESHMIFEAGKTYCTDYVTLLGTLRMEIAAERVAMDEDADGTRRIAAKYRLCQAGEPVAVCELDIRFI